MTDKKYARRDVLNKIVGGGVIVAGLFGAEEAREYLSESDGSGGAGGAPPATDTPESGFSPGALNEWDSIEKCLSREQEESVSEVVGRYDNLSRNDLRYSLETDGNVVMHRPAEDGYEAIAQTRENDFMCEIDY
jgi:hypothetical protein